MPYNAADDALLTPSTYKRSGTEWTEDAPASRSGMWNNFGTATDPSTPSARSSAARSTSASPTSTSPTTTGRLRARAESNFGLILLRRPLRPYRDELILSTKAGYDMWAGPVRRVGLAQVPALLARPEPRRALGRGLRRHLLLPPARPRHPDRRDHGRASDRGHVGQGAVRGHLELRPRAQTRAAEAALAVHNIPLTHPPAALQHVRPAHRGRRSVPGSRRPGRRQRSCSPRSRRDCSQTVIWMAPFPQIRASPKAAGSTQSAVERNQYLERARRR